MHSPPQSGFDGDFSYRFYEDLLSRSSERFQLLPLRDFAPPQPPGRPRLYLRHDIDLCLRSAHRMAEVEARMGVSSTYMFIPTSPLYDITSPDGMATLRGVQDLGHEVAIHFDVATSGIANVEDRGAVLDAIDDQCGIISDVTGSPVASVSFHRPLAQFLRGGDYLRGRVNAYSQTLMTFYRSDSGGIWRAGNPMKAEFEGAPAQLLTHPIWWDEGHQCPPERLEAFFQSSTRCMDPAALADFDRLLGETVPRVRRQGLNDCRDPNEPALA